MEKWVYRGQYIQVSELEYQNQIWEKAHFRGGVIIYPITDDNQLILIKEFRPHETPQVRLKPVTGIYEEEFSWQENANRELQEEIGLKAHQLELILETRQSGSINGFQKYVMAKNLEPSKLENPDGEESIQEIIHIPLKKLEEKIYKQEIPWSHSILGMFLLLRRSELFLS